MYLSNYTSNRGCEKCIVKEERTLVRQKNISGFLERQKFFFMYEAIAVQSGKADDDEQDLSQNSNGCVYGLYGRKKSREKTEVAAIENEEETKTVELVTNFSTGALGFHENEVPSWPMEHRIYWAD